MERLNIINIGTPTPESSLQVVELDAKGCPPDEIKKIIRRRMNPAFFNALDVVVIRNAQVPLEAWCEQPIPATTVATQAFHNDHRFGFDSDPHPSVIVKMRSGALVRPHEIMTCILKEADLRGGISVVPALSTDFAESMQEVAHRVGLLWKWSPHDMLLFNNMRCLHGRYTEVNGVCIQNFTQETAHLQNQVTSGMHHAVGYFESGPTGAHLTFPSFESF